jgi:hypothetical protein
MNPSGMRSITRPLAVQCDSRPVTVYTNDEWLKVETQDGLERYYRLSTVNALSHWVKRDPNLLALGISLLFFASLFAGWIGLTPGIVLDLNRGGILGLLAAGGLIAVISYFTTQAREISMTFGSVTLKLSSDKDVSKLLWTYLEQSYGLS